MKKILLITILSIASWPLIAQYQPVMMRQTLELPDYRGLTVASFGNAQVTIVQDTTDYVAFFVTSAADTATLPNGLIKVFDSNYGYGNIGILSYPTVLFVELHLQKNDLYIAAEDYSSVTLNSANSRDSLQYKRLVLQSSGHSTLKAERHIHSHEIILRAHDFGIVRCSSYTSPKYSEEHWRNGLLVVGSRNGKWEGIKEGEYRQWGNIYDFTRRYRPIERVHLSVLGGFHNWGTGPLNGLAGTEYVPDYREVAYWERNAWEDAASTKTTLGSIQAELTYDIVARRNYTIGLGLGYERDEYSLRHPFVSWVESTDIPVQTNKINTILYHYTGFSILPEIGEITYRRQELGHGWNSRFVTNYAILPIYFTYYADQNHKKGFHAGVAVVPGMALSKGKLVRHFNVRGDRVPDSYTPNGDTTWGVMAFDIHDVQELKVNAKVDVRLSVGWGNWSLFLQLSTIPIIADERTLDLYPMKMGAIIRL